MRTYRVAQVSDGVVFCVSLDDRFYRGLPMIRRFSYIEYASATRTSPQYGDVIDADAHKILGLSL